MTAFTLIGSLPGTDMGAALRMTFDRSPRIAAMPELPARGPWAGIIGRGLGLPGGLPAELAAGEWRLTDAVGIDQRRSRATWRDDLDQLEETAPDFDGQLKLAVTGPWTLAASLGVAHTGRVLADRGARRDVAQSLAASAAELLADVGRRLPRATVILQIDEPALPAVAAGAVPTPGGFFRHQAVDLPEIAAGLRGISTSARPHVDAVLMHSCAGWTGPGRGWPIEDLLSERGGGLDGVSLDIDQLGAADLDALGHAAEADARLYLGVLPTQQPLPGVDALAERTLRLWERIGHPRTERVVLTPACGLAGWTGSEVTAGVQLLARVGERLDEAAAG